MRHPPSSFRGLPILWGWILVWCILLLTRIAQSNAAAATSLPHAENYAVIVSSSRYWFNYRHAVNALTMYQILKRDGGFTDDRIILMMADEYAVNPRNPYKNFMTSAASTATTKPSSSSSSSSSSLFDGDEIEIDYRGEDVTVENLARVLSGKTPISGGASSSLLPVIPPDTPAANILLYVTGHGGDSFFKFQDVEEIMAADFAALFATSQRSFHQALFMADTCQAFTLGDNLPGESEEGRVIMIGSSLRDESSYAHHSNADLGLASIERYTFAVEQFFAQQQQNNNNNNNVENKNNWKQTTRLYDALVAPYTYESQRAHIGIRPAFMQNDTQTVVADFFVNRQPQDATTSAPQLWSPQAVWKTNTGAGSEETLLLPQPQPPPSTPTSLTWNVHPWETPSTLFGEDAFGPLPLIACLLAISLVSLASKRLTTSTTSSLGVTKKAKTE
eukprot:scaffold1555_cov173-Amphora_coffeaeformis.AAC.18